MKYKYTHTHKLVSTNLNKSCHAKTPANTKHVLDVKVRQHGSNQENRIGTFRTRIIDLPDVNDKILTE